MPLLAALIASGIAGLAEFLARFLGVKIAVAAAFVASFTAAFAALMLLLGSVVAPLLSALFTSYPYTGWMSLAFPPVTSACVSAMGTTWAGVMLYRWQRDALRLGASV